MKRITLLLLIVVLTMTGTVAYGATMPFFDKSLIGIPFPNIQNVVLKTPVKDYFENNYRHQYYENFTEEDYLLLSRFYYGVNRGIINLYYSESRYKTQLLSLTGQEIVTYVTASRYPDHGVRICWDWVNKTLECIYDPGIYLDNSIPVGYPDKVITPEDLGEFLIFPNAAFGRATVMPSIDIALKRDYDAKVFENNQTKYVYLSFTDQDYDTLGKYLENAGCSLTDYTVDGNVITLTIEKNQNIFQIRYDRDSFTAEAFYGQSLEPEKYEPPVASAKTDSQATGIYLDENQCYETAVQYINSTLKNPMSLQIHSCSKDIKAEKVIYVFDYSAMNSFGGYTRAYYYITVDRYTGKITFALST